MKALLSIVAAGALAGAVPFPATAQAIDALRDQVKPPASIPDGKISEAERGRVTLARYAECLVARRRVAVERALELKYGAEAFAAFGRLAIDECLADGRLRFSPVAMRGPLFLALYRAKYGRQPTPPAVPADSVDFAKAAQLTSDEPAFGEFVAIRSFADCVVRRAPGPVHAALQSTVGTSAETQAYQALAPDLSPCLPAGQSFRLNKLVLGGLLAEVFYLDAADTSRAKDG